MGAFGLTMVLGEVLYDAFDFAKKWNESVLQAEEGELLVLQSI